MQNNNLTKESLMSHKEYKFDTNKKTLQEHLGSDDYGLIVSKDGELKGIWIPDTAEDKENFPQEIAQLCIDHFGLDPNGDDEYAGATLH
tara:strand:+ start:368 stop:634 length:267 start_codon:yes stop_codon:yes gene_type:complete